MRITKVYTKTGDAGETSLVGGARVSKADRRVSAFGDVDETNSAIGLARTFLADHDIDHMLGKIQNELFILGADLASPPAVEVPRVTPALIAELETLIDQLLETLSPLTEFILPGGGAAGATLHLARTIARRAERSVVALAAEEEINQSAVIYLNRLSDFLFVVARAANHRAGIPEPLANFSARQPKSEAS